MHILKRKLAVNDELQRRWASDARQPEHRPVTLASGDQYEVVEYFQSTPLLWEKAISSFRLSAETIWHVAFDALAIKLKTRGHVSAFVRPLRYLEIKNGADLTVLDSLAADFHKTRERAIHALEQGEVGSYCIRRRDQLLACLCQIPPLTPNRLPAATKEEMWMLESIRKYRISRAELDALLSAYHRRRDHRDE